MHIAGLRMQGRGCTFPVIGCKSLFSHSDAAHGLPDGGKRAEPHSALAANLACNSRAASCKRWLWRSSVSIASWHLSSSRHPSARRVLCSLSCLIVDSEFLSS